MLEVWLADVGIAVRNGTLGTFTLELLLVQCNDVRTHDKELGTCLSDVISIKIRWLVMIALGYVAAVNFGVVRVISGVLLHETFRVASTDDTFMCIQKDERVQIMVAIGIITELCTVQCRQPEP